MFPMKHIKYPTKKKNGKQRVLPSFSLSLFIEIFRTNMVATAEIQQVKQRFGIIGNSTGLLRA